MKIIETNSYEVKLYIGSKEGYHGSQFDRDKLCKLIAKYQNNLPREKLISLRISQCLYLVGDWQEEGWEIACINYPRFPKSSYDIDKFMMELGKYLLVELKQNRVTVSNMYNNKTIESDSAEVTHEK